MLNLNGASNVICEYTSSNILLISLNLSKICKSSHEELLITEWEFIFWPLNSYISQFHDQIILDQICHKMSNICFFI
jgi:hypothetical protein